YLEIVRDFEGGRRESHLHLARHAEFLLDLFLLPLFVHQAHVFERFRGLEGKRFEQPDGGFGDRPTDNVAVYVENADRVTLQDRRRVHVLGHLEPAERDAGDRTQIKAADALTGVTRRGFAAVVDNHAAVLFEGLFDHRAAHGEIG